MANEFIARNGIVSKSNLVVSGSLTALNTITAQTLVVQTITSSISSITGSTNFGTLSSNTHTFTGSMSVSGSGTFDGALSGTSATFSGNIGIGATLASWISSADALQLNNTAALYAPSSEAILGNNIYVNSADENKYITSNYASQYRQVNGQHLFYSADSGTAGNTISFGSPKLTIASTGAATFTPSSSKSISTYTPSSWTGISDYVTSGVGWQFTRPNDGAFAHAIFTFNGTSTNNLAISSRSDLVIATGGGLGEAAERLRITSDGKLKLTSTTTGGTNLDMYVLENDGLYINSNEGATARAIYFQTGGTEKMRLTSGGAIYMNTNSALPGSGTLLHVNSQDAGPTFKNSASGQQSLMLWNAVSSGDNLLLEFNVNTSIAGKGSIDYNRTSNVIRYNTTSDANLKNIIGDSDKQKSIDILNTTKIKEYSWKEDETNKPQIGVIAQELYETFKGAVSVGSDESLLGTEDYKSWKVDKTAFTFHLIAGWQKHEQLIQEQQAQIQELTARVQELENK